MFTRKTTETSPFPLNLGQGEKKERSERIGGREEGKEGRGEGWI